MPADEFDDPQGDDGDADGDQPKKPMAPSLQISQAKLRAFQLGFQKKTPFQKQKEAEEARRKEEEDAAARVYVDFVASLEADSGKPKGWVKGATIVPSALFDKEEAERKSEVGTIYRPQSKFSLPDTPKASESSGTGQKFGKKRQLDAFLEEIKQSQETKEVRTRQKTGSNSWSESQAQHGPIFEEVGSHDTGDPRTTNLYVGNINPAVDEELLSKEFAVYGPIASVKVMWPRTQEEKERNRNCGFVSFMKRSDAEKAVKAMDGKVLLGFPMRVGWGKAVPIPAQPIYVLDTKAKSQTSGLPFNAQAPQPPLKGRPAPGSGLRPTPSKPEVRVQIPDDLSLLTLIHRMIERVLVHGPMFEALIMDREANNPQFSFLFQNDSPEHVYYRWKMYSLLHGDSKINWPTETFSMFDEGPVWVPPSIPFEDMHFSDDDVISSSSDSEDEERVRHPPRQNAKGALEKRHRHKLEVLIRKLTFDRELIGSLMVFCIDHSDAADEIVDVIIKSLMLPGTPIFPSKIARLYLVSDILHNSACSVRNAWKYRSLFERQLPQLFTHLGLICKSIPARLRADQMRRAIFAVVAAWEKWIIFNRDFTDGLRASFSGRAADELARSKEAEKEERFRTVLREQKESRTGVFALDDDYSHHDMDIPPDQFSKSQVSSQPPSKPIGFVKQGWTGVDAATTPPSLDKPKPGFVPITATTLQPAKTTPLRPAAPLASRKKPLPIQSKLFADADDDDDDMFK
ncbi:hypothetical protein DFJ73DRAFT_813257 [Zopfochytrium polystomum]|nr:hypothetical protein DFJ73DRAFT_813257 [Zopfochytrium polystomum]